MILSKADVERKNKNMRLSKQTKEALNNLRKELEGIYCSDADACAIPFLKRFDNPEVRCKDCKVQARNTLAPLMKSLRNL